MSSVSKEPKPEIVRRSTRIKNSSTRTKNMQDDSMKNSIETKSNKSEQMSESKNYLNSKPKTPSKSQLKKKTETDSEYLPLMSSFPFILAINTLTISMIFALGIYKGKKYYDM